MTEHIKYLNIHFQYILQFTVNKAFISVIRTILGWSNQMIIYVYGDDNTNIVQILVWSGTDILFD